MVATSATGPTRYLIRLLASTSAAGSAGAPVDVPGLGISADSVAALDELVGSDGAIYDVFAGVIRYIGEHGWDIPGDDFADAEYTASTLPEQVKAYLELSNAAGFPFPDDPAEQLASAVTAMRKRWMSPRARRSRRGQGLPEDLPLAFHVQAVRVGPPEASGHGVAQSRDPITGAFAPTGTFRRGVRRSATDDRPGGESLDTLPGGRDVLTSSLRTLELHLKGAAQVEFEVRDGELSLLAARKVERPAPRTAVRLAVDLAELGAMDDVAAVQSIRASDLESLLHPQLQLTGRETEFGQGLPAAMGAAVGRVALSSDRAVELTESGEPVVLVAEETSPGDLPGMLAAKAIVTSRGGLAAHAAVVARGLGRPAVCGATALRIDRVNRTISCAGHTVAEGELISVDGSSGMVYTGAVHVVPPRPGGDLEALLRRADRLRRLGVRTNADNGRDAALALQYGAEGVGLCRTEHQFLGDRLPLVRRYLLATDPDEEAAALVELAAAQKEDFLDLLSVTGDLPVTVRLLDAPLHEFLGESAYEVNPMLGLRGVRLALTRTELYPAQARALFSAWVELAEGGIQPRLEVMVPLVALAGELAAAIESIHRAADEIEESYRRARALHGRHDGGDAARGPDRRPAGRPRAIPVLRHERSDPADVRFLPRRRRGPAADGLRRTAAAAGEPVRQPGPRRRGTRSSRSPFGRPGRSIPASSWGSAANTAVTRRRSRLCERLGLDYVSCSPSRVPGARLAAAHAARRAR